MISENQVVVISGETGCGKTTQVPQLILDYLIKSQKVRKKSSRDLCLKTFSLPSCLHVHFPSLLSIYLLFHLTVSIPFCIASPSSSQGARANMVCTQPRRISAMGVADRVAQERAERVGQSVGYQIRLESRRSKETRLLFCTTGVLLRRLQCDSELAGVSHIFVDEIHERDLNSDFLLIILKKLLRARPDIKLVLMSATLNAELFADYFGGAPVLHIPGRTFPVKTFFLEDAIEHARYTCAPGSEFALDSRSANKRQQASSKSSDDDPLADQTALMQYYCGGKTEREIKTLLPKVRGVLSCLVSLRLPSFFPPPFTSSHLCFGSLFFSIPPCSPL